MCNGPVTFHTRALTDDDLDALRRLDEEAFGFTVDDARWAVSSSMLERPRQLGAFDGDRLIGHVAAFSMELSVPGGTTPAAGVTWVATAPQARRRGVMRQLLTTQLNSLSEEGEAIAVLHASETPIYGRFGYGAASRSMGATVPRPNAGLSRGLTPAAEGSPRVTVDDVDDSTMASCVQVYEHVRPRRPGLVSRSRQAWQFSTFDAPTVRGNGSALRVALARGQEDAGATGYAIFRVHPSWLDGVPEGRVEVQETLATSPGAERALLGFLLDLDLTTSIHFANLPVDAPLLHRLRDTRRARPRIGDGLWVRPVRLAEALTSRAYANEVDLVLDVVDETAPWNAGRWRLQAGPSGSTCEPSSLEPHLRLDVAVLGAALLGDPVLGPAARAGDIAELSVGAVARAHQAFTADPPPWCPFIF